MRIDAKCAQPLINLCKLQWFWKLYGRKKESQRNRRSNEK